MPDAPVYVTEGGLSPINEGPIELSYTRERGWAAVYRAEGRLAEIRTKANEKIAEGFSNVRMASKSGGDMYVLTAESGAVDPATGLPTTDPDSLITSVWNILGNELEKDLWEKPEIKYIMDAVKAQGGTTSGAHGCVILRGAVDSYLRGNTTYSYKDYLGADFTINLTLDEILLLATQLTELAPGDVTPFNVSNLSSLIESLAKGVEKFPVSQWVLEHTQTGPVTSSLRGVTDNTNRVHTRDYMQNVQQVPTNKLSALPDGVYLKKTPSVMTEGDKLTVKTQWWWAETWDTFALGESINE